jgi:hypothetical protein
MEALRLGQVCVSSLLPKLQVQDLHHALHMPHTHRETHFLDIFSTLQSICTVFKGFPGAPELSNNANTLHKQELGIVLVTVQVPDHVDARPVLTRKVRNSLKTRLFGLLESSVQRHPGPPDCAMLPTDKTKNI